jgi:putative DNA primase/helicase
MPPDAQPPNDATPPDEAKARIKQLFDKGNITTDEVYSEEILRALACIDAHDVAAFVRYRDALRQLKIPIKDLPRAMKPYQPLLRIVHEGDSQDKLASDFLSDAPLPQLVIPPPYALDHSSTDRMVEDDNGVAHPQAIAYAPILITGRLQSVDDHGQWLRLAWKRGDSWQHADVDRGVAMNANRLLLELASLGFPVASDNAGHVAHYLHQLEAANYQPIPTAKMATRLGWQGEQGAYGFLCGRTLARPGEVLVIDDLSSVPTTAWDANWIAFHGSAVGDDQIVNGFHARGTYDGWCEAVRPIMDYPKVRLGFYASFAVPLLELLHVPNFVIDWSARTSVGKTTTLRAAASVWGCPDERQTGESIIFSWNATKVWSERAAAVLNGLPFILDESKLAAKGVVPSVLYMVANGIGKGRGNPRGLAQARRWRTILFSTGESPVTGFTEDGGSRMRCLAIRGYPFGAKNDATLKVVGELNTAVCRNYGHAGPRFIQWVLEHPDRWPSWEKRYEAIRDALIKKCRDDAAYRLADYAAVIVLAARLAHAALAFPWEQPDVLLDELWRAIVDEASGAAGDLRALRDLMSWAVAHQKTFDGRGDHDRDGTQIAPTQGWSGRWDKGGTWDEIGFFPGTIDRVLTERGYDPKAIIVLWKDQGWLVGDSDGKHIGKQVRVDGEKTRMITFSRETIDTLEA